MVQEKFKEKTIVEVILLVLTLLPTLTGNFLSQVNATLTADSWVTEITGLSFTPYLVETDLDGNVYVKATDNDVYKSIDQCSTWTKVLDKTASEIVAFLLFCDSRGYIYTSHWDGDNFDTYRSIDDGDSFAEVMSEHVGLWHMAEDSNGNLFVNTYSDSNPCLYNSTDSGATFNVMLNASEFGINHLHCVGVDSANDDVYVGMGDSNDRIMKWDGESWTNVTTEAESLNLAQPTDIWSDGSYVYFAPDGNTELWRMPSGGTWSQAELVLDTSYAPQSTDNECFEGVNIGDIMLMGTEEGQLYGSWDGEHWVKLLYTEGDEPPDDSIFSISNREPIYFVERDEGRLWRLNVQKDDLIHLFYEEYYARKGDLTNAETFVLEQPIWNGTNYIDLTNVALSDVQASIIGLNRSNWQPNAGFENGDKTGWTEAYAPVGVIRSDSPANGTYYYARNHSDANNLALTAHSNTVVDMPDGSVTLISFYIKSNASDTEAFRVGYWTTGQGYRYNDDIDVTTSWVRHCYGYVNSDADVSGKYLFGFRQNHPLETCIDSFEFVVLETGIHAAQTLNEDAIAYYERMTTGTFDDDNQTTTNPTLTVGGQSVSHAGFLANGTESSTTSLTGTLTGTVEVSANIQGSGQAILKLNGTRLLYEDSIILKGRTQNVYYGRYYGTLLLTINTTDLLALTNLQANITSLSFDGSKLTLIVDSPSGTTSTTKVYCGDKYDPTAVYATNGTLTWSYNASTNMLTLDVVHNSSANILVDWRIPGDVNGDGKVDYSDLFDLSEAYCSCVHACDLNRDGVVDIFDISIVGKNYGKTKT